jgi:hypothetical protein
MGRCGTLVSRKSDGPVSDRVGGTWVGGPPFPSAGAPEQPALAYRGVGELERARVV